MKINSGGSLPPRCAEPLSARKMCGMIKVSRGAAKLRERQLVFRGKCVRKEGKIMEDFEDCKNRKYPENEAPEGDGMPERGMKCVYAGPAYFAAKRDGEAANRPSMMFVYAGPADMRNRRNAEPETPTPTPAVQNYCHNCGEKLAPTYRFCPNCGTPVNRGGAVTI